MTYTLNFALNLNKEGENIIYDSEQFADQPIQISVPQIITILERFIGKPFHRAGLIENRKSEKVQIKDAFSEKKVQDEVKAINENLIAKSSLKGLSGQAYYCQIKELDTQKINEITSDLSNYLQESISSINSENFLADETSVLISALKEVVEIRNYLARYFKKAPNKMYRNGYFVIILM
ncbi:hypothetical protein [Laspinema olomoucense]|uniref:Uncharacterized protein n=1 Tax=Laspinema olomoucense D3b TaxID=2953688 RepID=A0ABT2NF62_9CYAN|nr:MULTISPECIES: hypothetical protein [unclassified Laspinema]MCT7973961.1 hypothetical protein [Laspinema sp. D3d]MCT7980355.1 hypothetical protein [Laspinema sp. D3b]MCT7991937.1 hypothetical protein [Laspinema sp. D3a]